MSAQAPTSPRQQPSDQQTPSPPPQPQIDESRLPNGQCRYILLNPEIKGQRCACVGFSLNRTLPGVTCECGHLSCYHIKSAQPPPDKTEIDLLRARVHALEGQLDRENSHDEGGAGAGGLGRDLGKLTRRLSALEDEMDRARDESQTGTQGCHQSITRMWQVLDELDQRQANRDMHLDERIDAHADTLQRYDERLNEISDTSISLEERIEELEDSAEARDEVNALSPAYDPPKLMESPWQESFDRASSPRRRLDPHSKSPLPSSPPLSDRNAELLPIIAPSAANSPIQQPASCSNHAGTVLATRSINPSLLPPATSQNITKPYEWTVHISLLPTASQPFPFEKDTNAYKRCLSRGLHHMVPIGGADCASFSQAVEKTFGGLLKGREWVPLQARLCDVAALEGLPMLRPLDSRLVSRDQYDFEFLRRHCGVLSPSGAKIESLYIAMRFDTFSWNFLRRSPCILDGLETSWAFDEFLDRHEGWADDSVIEPSAGDLVTQGLPPLSQPPYQQQLKRPASEISGGNRGSHSGNGSASDGTPTATANEGDENGGNVAAVSATSSSRANKIPRTSSCIPGPPLELQRQGVKTI